MGLIKAALGAAGGTMADQWKEFFYCDALDADTLVKRGEKQTSRRSSNKRGNENIISNGSGIAVADGQCMLIVEQGKIVEVCAEPGEYTFDQSTEPSIFCGSLGEGIRETFATIGKRFTYGGDTGKDQRVYYCNTKEIPNNKYGTPNPVPFRVVDRNIGLDMDISVRCNGIYSYQIVDPLLFYTNVCGNVEQDYGRESIDQQLKSELLTALQPAFARISEMGIRYSALPGHTMELADALNDILSEKWQRLRGLKICSFGVNSVTANPEDEELIKQLQRNAVMRDPSMAAASLVGAQAQAMQDAANNSSGAMTGFMGMGFAQQAGGGTNAQSLFQMGRSPSEPQQAAAPSDRWSCSCGAQNTGKFCQNCGKAKPVPAAAAGAWVCSCGARNSGKFCVECGKPRPEEKGWRCSCGAVNTGKFCAECGKPKPAGAPLYCCDKCGWTPEDPMHPPKFCPECGDAFDENDQT